MVDRNKIGDEFPDHDAARNANGELSAVIADPDVQLCVLALLEDAPHVLQVRLDQECVVTAVVDLDKLPLDNLRPSHDTLFSVTDRGVELEVLLQMAHPEGVEDGKGIEGSGKDLDRLGGLAEVRVMRLPVFPIETDDDIATVLSFLLSLLVE